MTGRRAARYRTHLAPDSAGGLQTRFVSLHNTIFDASFVNALSICRRAGTGPRQRAAERRTNPLPDIGVDESGVSVALPAVVYRTWCPTARGDNARRRRRGRRRCRRDVAELPRRRHRRHGRRRRHPTRQVGAMRGDTSVQQRVRRCPRSSPRAKLPTATAGQCYFCDKYRVSNAPGWCEYRYDGWTVDYCCMLHDCDGACAASALKTASTTTARSSR